jgi:hypothetical protein
LFGFGEFILLDVLGVPYGAAVAVVDEIVIGFPLEWVVFAGKIAWVGPG